jgi:hypothetical protein
MTEQTISATYTLDQIYAYLLFEQTYSLGLKQQPRIEFKSDTIVIETDKPLSWVVMPIFDPDIWLKEEFEAWDAASDEDYLKLEASLYPQ